jgi:hypothetical protein
MKNRSEVLVELQSLIAEYWASVDRIPDVKRTPASFYVEEGEMILGPLHVRGRDNIDAFFRTRNEKEIANRRTTRHFAPSLRLQGVSEDRASVHAIVLVHSGIGDWPLLSEPPSALGDFSFQCVQDPAQGWLFETLTGTSVFAGAGAASFAKGPPPSR